MKTNIKTLTHILTTALSALLILAVFLTATHVKDIVNTTPLKQKQAVTNDPVAARGNTGDDPVQKSVNDLHSHTDKTMLKSFVQSLGDASSLAARKEHEGTSEDQPISVRFIEMILMARLTFGFVFA